MIYFYRWSPTKSLGGSSGSAGFDAETFERKLREAKNEILRQKDDELAKMHIQVSSKDWQTNSYRDILFVFASLKVVLKPESFDILLTYSRKYDAHICARPIRC